MRFIIYLFAFLFLLVAAAVVVIPMIVPAEELEARVEAAATNALGREVTIEGAPKISVFPTRVQVAGLKVANAEGFSAPHLLSVEAADIGVKLLPLIQGQVEITHFNLDAPDIRLQATEEGDANWILGTQKEAAPEENPNTGPSRINDIRLGDVRVNDGLVTYDNGTGTVYTAEDADLVLTLTSLDDPLQLDGNMILQGEPTTLSLILTTPRSFTETKTADVQLSTEVGENVIATGLTLGENLSYAGNIDVNVPALRDLIGLLGTQIETPNGFRNLRLKGPIEGNTEVFSFGEGTELTFDKISGTGAITIALSGARPKISGAMKVNGLDLRPYLPEETPQMAAQKKGEASGGFPAWSTEEMDFSALGTVDTDLRLSTESITLPSLDIGRSTVDLKINNQNINATLSEMRLYEGAGSGTLTANLRGNTPQMAANFQFSDMNVGAFAQALTGLTRLQGNGDIALNITTSGNSQAAMVKALNGSTKVNLDQGGLKGVNLGKIARSAMQTYNSLRTGKINVAKLTTTFANISQEARGETQETDFSDLAVDLLIRNGIVTSQTISLIGPYYRMSGSGTVNLPQQTMQIKITPSVSPTDGEEMRSLPVPLQISGSFNDPKIGVDAQPLVRELATGQVRDLLGQQGIDVAPGQNIEETLRNTAATEIGKLLGGNRKSETADGTDENEAQKDEEPLSPEEQLIQQGLGALFGTTQQDSEEEKAE